MAAREVRTGLEAKGDVLRYHTLSESLCGEDMDVRATARVWQ